jgi:glycosyltransferase involved in cell wall biosynthesis
VVGETCESLLTQKDCLWEAVFIDAGSQDRTVEIIHSYRDKRFRVQTLSQGSIFALINRGILMSQAPFVQILVAGCTYLTTNALATVFAEIEKREYPDLFITASYVGDINGLTHFYFEKFAEEDLLQGLQPALLQSCFFKRELFKKAGYFSTNYLNRSALDFFCRLYQMENLRWSFEERVFVELDIFPKGIIKPPTLIYETWQVVRKHFGFVKSLLWLYYLKRNYHKKVLHFLWQ